MGAKIASIDEEVTNFGLLKEGLGMQEDILKAFETFGKQAMASAKEVVDYNNAFLNQVLDAQVNIANLYVEGAEKQLALLEAIKEPGEYVEAQTRLVQEYAEKIAVAAQRNVEISQQASEQVKEWIDQTATATQEAFQSAMDSANK